MFRKVHRECITGTDKEFPSETALMFIIKNNRSDSFTETFADKNNRTIYQKSECLVKLARALYEGGEKM